MGVVEEHIHAFVVTQTMITIDLCSPICYSGVIEKNKTIP